MLSEEEVREARRTVGEVKNELTAPVQEFKDGVKHSVDELKAEAAIPEEADGPTINSPPRRRREAQAEGRERSAP